MNTYILALCTAFIGVTAVFSVVDEVSDNIQEQQSAEYIDSKVEDSERYRNYSRRHGEILKKRRQLVHNQET